MDENPGNREKVRLASKSQSQLLPDEDKAPHFSNTPRPSFHFPQASAKLFGIEGVKTRINVFSSSQEWKPRRGFLLKGGKPGFEPTYEEEKKHTNARFDAFDTK